MIPFLFYNIFQAKFTTGDPTLLRMRLSIYRIIQKKPGFLPVHHLDIPYTLIFSKRFLKLNVVSNSDLIMYFLMKPYIKPLTRFRFHHKVAPIPARSTSRRVVRLLNYMSLYLFTHDISPTTYSYQVRLGESFTEAVTDRMHSNQSILFFFSPNNCSTSEGISNLFFNDDKFF